MASQVQGMDGDHAAEEGSLGWIEYCFPEFGDRDAVPGCVQACNRACLSSTGFKCADPWNSSTPRR